MRFLTPAFIFCGVVASYAQTPIVPHKLNFSGMTLIIRDDARREIQKDVDALTQSPKYFNIKVERAKTYFPIIERIFAEERVPDDFKYLALQESALIPDAVSVSNAVGFWQFKDFTAKEVGLRVDKEIDERMNIVAATRGAAKYIKQNNFMFNNWLYALQAYQMGAGGVKRLVGDDLDGSRHMEITSDTYWYIKKYLAHKVAFEAAAKGDPQLKITEQVLTKGGALKEISAALAVEHADLLELNKWVRNDKIPEDRPYTLIIPGGNITPSFSILYPKASTPVRDAVPAETTTPVVGQSVPSVMINEVPVLMAMAGESVDSFARRAGISAQHLLRFNDMKVGQKINGGAEYFVAKKKTRASADYHHMEKGEDLWMVSQRYGIQLKKLKRLNRLDDSFKPAAGVVLWLSSSKPREGVLGDDPEDVLELEEEVFEWARQGNGTPVTEKIKTVVPQNDPVKVETTGLHVVQSGETLYAISKKYGVSVGDLALLNNLVGTQEIKPGMELKVSVDEGEAPEPITRQTTNNVHQRVPVIHEIKSSDTLYSVARQYGVTIKDLMESNNKKDFSVSLGEKLTIPAP